MNRTASKFVVACALQLTAGGAWADLEADIQSILALDAAPPGVVFEIVSGNKDYLEDAIPKVSAASERLRARFEGISIAVVTHGREQFALTRDKADENQPLHDLVKTLSSDREIPVHVCGTHAGWFGMTPEAFPEYVDVAAAGPTQVQQYRELGYRLILVR